MMPIRLNLATKPYYNRRAMQSWLLAIGLLLVVLLGLNVAYAYQTYSQYRQVGTYLEELQSRLAEVKNIKIEGFGPKAYEAALNQVGELNRILEADQFRWTALLTRLEELLPDGVKIISIQPDYKSHSLKLMAASRDIKGMTDFLDALLASPDLNQVILQHHQEQNEGKVAPRAGEAIDFALQIKEAF